jgi:glycosyltransferase involved in cell wall biosynthesis
VTEVPTLQSGLDTRLESELPSRLAVGGGTAIFLEGRCAHPERAIRRLEVVIGSTVARVSASGMPRPGTISKGDWWWAFVPIAPVSERTIEEVYLRAHFAGGETAESLLGVVSLVPEERIPVTVEPRGSEDAPLVAICMATYNPPRELFSEQVESIRRQTHERWVCVISDDCSDPEGSKVIEEIVGDDPRFFVSRAESRGGFYRNFGRAISMCPPDATHVALSDQDDRWYPEKLERLLAALEPSSQLVYSDARLVDESGAVISDTYWRARRNNFENFTSLMLANTITGAASLFRAELLQHVLPFPPPQGNIYHDHWLATVAMALGSVSYVDEPLYEYVQHDAAVVGHARANSGVARTAKRPARQAPRNWRSLFFGANCRIALFARVLEARCGHLMSPGKRRVVRRMTRVAEARRLLPWLLVRAERARFGWNETAGREEALAKGLGWRHATPARLRAQAARRRLRGGNRHDQALPDPAAELPVRARASFPSVEDGLWLTPLLVDYFGRDGSTLMMRLLGTSPEIVIGDKYPFERKYFAYLWRWSRMLDRAEWPRETWRPADLASLDQESAQMMMGPPPWLPRGLFDEGGSGSFSQFCFHAAWSEFSRRAVNVSSGPDPRVTPRLYAEKHANTWLVDLGELPESKLVVLLRDPRDTFVSIKSFAEVRGADFGRGRVTSDGEYLEHVVSRQKRRLRWIEQLLAEGEVPVVRYEDLVTDIDGVAKRLSEALSVDLNPEATRSDRDLHKRHATTTNPQSSIGRWREELTEAEIEVFDRSLGAEMASVGLPL